MGDQFSLWAPDEIAPGIKGPSAPAPADLPPLKLRDYQEKAVSKVLWSMQFPDNDLIVIPTGGGKSIVIAAIANALREKNFNIVILQPSKELLEQNYAKLLRFMPEDRIGIFSASMHRREADRQITFATIQTVYKCPELFQNIGLIIIDEADLMNQKNELGMFNTFIQGVGKPKVVGLTATPYRNDIGYHVIPGAYADSLEALTTCKLINRTLPKKGAPCFWKRLLYNINHRELVEKGFLIPLRYESVDPVKHEDIEVNKSKSEFVLTAFEKKLSEKDQLIVDKIRWAMDHHRSILVFCSSVGQAKRLSSVTMDISNQSEWVSGDTPEAERAEIMEGFRNGSIKIVFNMNVLTVGFDHPGLDCIIMIRPTRSLRLYYQMLGRGVRPYEEEGYKKEYCQVIDFSNNVEQIGPVESIELVKEFRPGEEPKSGEKKYPKWEIKAGGQYWHNRALYSWTVKEIAHAPAPKSSLNDDLDDIFGPANDPFDLGPADQIPKKAYSAEDDFPF